MLSGQLKVLRTYIIFFIKKEAEMPWVKFDINQFKGREVREDEYPEYFHLDAGAAEMIVCPAEALKGLEQYYTEVKIPEERNDEK